MPLVVTGSSARRWKLLEANVASDIVDNGGVSPVSGQEVLCPLPASNRGSTRSRTWPRSSTCGWRRSMRWSAAASCLPSSWAGVECGGWTATSSRPTSSGCTRRRPSGPASTRSSARPRKRDRRDRGQAQEPACLHRASAACLAGVVLGDLQVVAADGFDGAVDPAAVDQLDPDRLAAACELAEGERQPVAAGGSRGCRLEGGRLGREGDRGRRPVGDQVLGPVAVLEDQELWIAGDQEAAEAAAAGVGDR